MPENLEPPMPVPKTANAPHVFFNVALSCSLVTILCSVEEGDGDFDTLMLAMRGKALELLSADPVDVTSLRDAGLEWLAQPQDGQDVRLCICVEHRPRVFMNVPPSTKFENIWAQEIATTPFLATNGISPPRCNAGSWPYPDRRRPHGELYEMLSVTENIPNSENAYWEGTQPSQHAHRIREVVFRRSLSIARKFKPEAYGLAPGFTVIRSRTPLERLIPE